MSERNMQYGRNVRRAYGHETDDVVSQEATVKEILDALQDISFLPVGSASPTVVITGKLRANPQISIFLKIFKYEESDGADEEILKPPHSIVFDEGGYAYEYDEDGKMVEPKAGTVIKNGEYGSLRNEYKIYNELYKLREMGATPNLLARVATYRLTAGVLADGGTTYKADEAQTFYNDPYIKQISNYRQYFHVGNGGRKPRIKSLPDVTSWTRTSCIMTCSVEYSLDDCVYLNRHMMNVRVKTYEDLVGILYQIVHVFAWFEHIELAHHDLHSGNIRVEYHEQPIDIYYQHNQGECVCVSTRHVIKIYDFDQSTIYKETDLGNGKVVQRALNKLRFETFNNKEDLFYIIMTLLRKDDYGIDDKVSESDPISSRQLLGLLNSLIPGYQSNASLAVELFSEAEKKSFENITKDYKKYKICNNDSLLERMLKGRIKFGDYVRSQSSKMLFYPKDVGTPCSLYLPDSIMLPKLQMLDVLSRDTKGGISIVPIEKARQPVYPTPNIYYADF